MSKENKEQSGSVKLVEILTFDVTFGIPIKNVFTAIDTEFINSQK
ncbi:hypothetical protein LCGC14_1622180 [marine sediment metagenome]|uniref:Uncharacterized protein n=1 Tax=marine sediment metagenome TaxID=412755 RepID=A0A0F9KKQ2_9ZZZZ